MALTPTLTQVKPQVPAPNTPANYNSTVSATPGVTGTSAVTQPSGATPADWGASANVGVFGFGAAIGIQGSGGAIGVQGAAPLTNSIGVQGTSNASSGVGVQGASSGQNGIGVQATSQSGNAIQASSKGDTDAVLVNSSSPNHAAVSATNTGGGFALWSSSTANNGIAIYGKGTAYAGQFDGNVQISGGLTGAFGGLNVADNINVSGTANVAGTLNVVQDIVLAAPASDCAEEFDVGTTLEVDPGTVMVVDAAGALLPSEQSYDRKVAGVISGAGEYRPGLILDRRDSSRRRVPIAVVGKVFVKADADYGPIEAGDLLTTSPTRGYAMKASDPLRAFGAVIGKALGPLSCGQGLVPVLVALQ